jgi:hypothetical protein
MDGILGPENILISHNMSHTKSSKVILKPQWLIVPSKQDRDSKKRMQKQYVLPRGNLGQPKRIKKTPKYIKLVFKTTRNHHFGTQDVIIVPNGLNLPINIIMGSILGPKNILISHKKESYYIFKRHNQTRKGLLFPQNQKGTPKK